MEKKRKWDERFIVGDLRRHVERIMKNLLRRVLKLKER